MERTKMKTTKDAAENPQSTKPLHVKYRPDCFADVVGQEAAVKALERMIKGRKSQAYLLTGPSGCGKTTLARIAATEWGCSSAGIMEIDAATNSGVDHVRGIQEAMRYRTFGEEGGRAIIVDECHGLSRQSWEALLKSIEEPPSHVVWFLCTTNPTKVPQTIKTRCTALALKPVSEKALGKLLDRVQNAEDLDTRDDICDFVIHEAGGSPRQMLVNFELCSEAETLKEARQLLQRAHEGDATIELCRFLLNPKGSWPKVMAIINRLASENPEGVRILICNYFGKVLANAKSDREAMHALGVLDQFATPYRQEEGIAPLLLSVGRTMFAND